MRALDPGGIDVFAADLAGFRAALTAENHTLKRALTDPRIFSGIGNAYSDEICTRHSFRRLLSRTSYGRKNGSACTTRRGTRCTLWIDRLRAEAAGEFPEKVTAFRPEMAVHGRFGQPCPRCGAKVQRIRYADNETNYCARCQTGGKAARRPQPLPAAGRGLAAHAGRAGGAETAMTTNLDPAPRISEAERRKAIGRVVRVSSGNFLEMYDFIVYGYYAIYIAQVFFPSRSQFASLMLSLMTFGAGYLMRPLGAVVLGAYIDRHGRRKGLLVTLLLMAVGTLSIAVTPGYASIGIFAPLIILVGRLLQGFSAGVELGGVSVYLTEIATPGHSGFYCAWQSASQQVAVVFTAVIGILLTLRMSDAQMIAWGWRVPFLVGCLIIPLLVWLMRSLEETQAYRAGTKPRSSGETFALLVANWQRVLIGVLLTVLTTTAFYLITAYTPTFSQRALHLSAVQSMVVTACVGLSNFLWVPVGGSISDRIRRRPLLIVLPALILLTAYPAMLWLVHAPSMERLMIVELWYSLLYGLYNGAMIPFVIELMPQKIRTAGLSLSYSLATATFGGFTPAVATYLIHATGNRAAPAIWLSVAGALSLIAALIGGRYSAPSETVS